MFITSLYSILHCPTERSSTTNQSYISISTPIMGICVADGLVCVCVCVCMWTLWEEQSPVFGKRGEGERRGENIVGSNYTPLRTV